MFVDCHRFPCVLRLNRDDSGIVQDIFRNNFGFGNKLKSPCWIPKLKFPNFRNLQCSVFVYNSLFESQISRSILYNMFIWTTRTILVSVKMAVMWKHVTKKRLLRKSHLWRLSGKWINSSGVSSEKLSYVRLLPQGLLFLKNEHFWKFQTCPVWKKCAFPYIWWPFQKWLPRPNHYAHEICIEILSRTPVLKSKYLWPGP